jgi:CheY-like chemotaxis protein
VLTLMDALTRHDFATVGRLGHDMSGSGASFGFPLISEIGAALELAAVRGDTDVAAKRVQELSTYVAGLGSAEVRGPPNPSVELATHAPPDVQPKAGARRIVIVEDDDDTRELFRSVLEHRGHHVKAACDGIEGLALILAEKPDIAFIDLGLPWMDGNELARKVRAVLGRSVFLVTMTGRMKGSDQDLAIAAGFDLHFTKPLDPRAVDRLLCDLPTACP